MPTADSDINSFDYLSYFFISSFAADLPIFDRAEGLSYRKAMSNQPRFQLLRQGFASLNTILRINPKETCFLSVQSRKYPVIYVNFL